jgi:hypothetical protein
LSSAWKQWKEKNNGKIMPKNDNGREVRPWDLLNPNTEYISEESSSNRYEICLQCPELIQITKQCKKCGCIMPLKTKLKMATCPLGKW